MTVQDLTLAAEDADDLQIVSARLQDALVQMQDIVWLPRARRFAAIFNRFKWESDGALRVRARLHFDGVLAVRSHNLRRDEPEAVASLLAIRFTPNAPDDPAGMVELVFSGGGTIRLDVECIDAALSDLGAAWPARARPEHDGV